jgi:hypothetical protein
MPDEPGVQARKFVAQFITSVAQLEMLLLLRTNPGESWSAENLARELRVETPWAEAQLRQFCDSGLAECSGSPEALYRFRAATPAIDEAVTALSREYLIHRVSIIEAIYSKPSGSIRVFADAFRIKKEPPNP